jgi:RNA polymerase sigma-70 factor, ECF subfamily
MEAMRTASPSSAVAEAFRQHERLLWGLAYRMTGSAADADDVVQDTFERAATHPPPRLDEPLRPWLVQVAMNVARDALRRRKHRGYVGPWLPSPLEGASDADAPEVAATDARYELHESASYAFLIALEALTPPQRAVLLLRDVLDYTVRETSAALSLSEVNVKVIHHRARRAMAEYDLTRRPGAALHADTRAALERFLSALLLQDTAAVEACLTDGARLLSDGGGEYRAALNPVVGPDRIARFFFGLQRKLGANVRYEVRAFNGLPGVVAEYDDPREGWGPRFVMRCDVDATGAIREVHIVVATAKLTGVAPIG